MRRSDREITDNDLIRKIISSVHVAHLGLSVDNKPYIIPMNYGFDESDGRYTFYFHSAGEGRKLDMIHENSNACLELDTAYQLVSGESACSYTSLYKSVLAEGTVSIVTEPDAKKHALCRIMAHETGQEEWNIPDAMLARVTVLAFKAESLSCKVHQ